MARPTGFTLIELLVVVAIVAILAALAGPNLTNMIRNNRLSASTNDLLADLALARSESSRRGKRVTLCISTDGSSCTTGSSWGQGRIIFEDVNSDGSRDTTNDTLLRVTAADANNPVTITASGFTNSSASSTNNYVQFRPTGALSSPSTGGFLICDSRSGAYGRNIQVSTTGRAYLTTSTATCP